MPNRDEPAVKFAYVRPYFDVGDNDDSIPFWLNVAEEHECITVQRTMNRQDSCTSRGLNASDFWVVYVLGAFQNDTANDWDPADETSRVNPDDEKWMGKTCDEGGSLVYLEPIREYARSKGWDAGVVEQETVVHEIGHHISNYEDEEPVTTTVFRQIDGIAPRVSKRYTPNYLYYIRDSELPNGR